MLAAVDDVVVVVAAMVVLEIYCKLCTQLNARTIELARKKIESVVNA